MTGPAPTLACHACRRTIGKRAAHNVTEDRRVLCTRCLGRRELHATLWPDCPHAGHDVYDHTPHVAGTRAGVAHLLGVWP